MLKFGKCKFGELAMELEKRGPLYETHAIGMLLVLYPCHGLTFRTSSVLLGLQYLDHFDPCPLCNNLHKFTLDVCSEATNSGLDSVWKV